MTVRWRTVIPLSSALIMFFVTCNIVTQLPTNSSSDDDVAAADDHAARGGRDGRSRQVLKLFPDDDDIVENKDDSERKHIDVVKRREKSLLLFDDDMVMPNDDKAQPDDNRNVRLQENVEDAKQQLVDEKLKNNEAKMVKQHDDSKDKNDDDGGELPMNDNGLLIPDKIDFHVDDRHDSVNNRPTDSRQAVNNNQLMENVRAVRAIVQRLKRRSDSVADVEVDQSSAPVNPHPFRYVINCPQLCADVDHLFLVVYVHTAVGHYKRRTVIRQTWGDVSQYHANIRVVFVMGVHAGSGIEARDKQTALTFEAERYQDIVQVSLLSNYAELTLHTVVISTTVLHI